MSTPGGDDPNAGNDGSDPDGGATPPPPPGAPNPYGGAPDPYGGTPNPYGGAPNPYAPPHEPAAPAAPYDGVSIGALVTAVLCCTGPIAVVLGLFGILRTKGGERRGRWMAVVGIVVGVLATIALVVAVIVAVWFRDQLITPDNAEAGQCADLVVDDDTTAVLIEKDCTDDHDVEIVIVGEYDGEPGGTLTTEVCFAQLSEDDVATLREADIGPEDVEVIAGDPEDMDEGDPYACYVDPDRTLDEPLLD